MAEDDGLLTAEGSLKRQILDTVHLYYDVPSITVRDTPKRLPPCLGYSPSEEAELLAGPWPLMQLAHPADRAGFERFPEAAEALDQGLGFRVLFRLRAKNGSYRPFSSTAFPAERDEQGKVKVLLVVLKDYTSEAERDRQLSYAQQSLELALDPFFRIGYDARIQEVNKAACNLLGCAREELVGQPMPYFDEAYALDLQRRLELMRHQQHASFESVLRSKDGKPVPLEVSASHLMVGDQESIFATCRDLRPRQELQDRLLQVEKLETVSELVGGVAHDFNNLLAIITAGLDQVRPNQDVDNRFRAMDEALERGAALVRRMQAFARRRALKTQAIDLLGLIEACRPRLRGVLGPQMELKIEGAADLPRALVDPAQVDEIILNLAMNARDAAGGRGNFTLRVEPYLVGLDTSQALGVQPGPFLSIQALDDGPGVPDNISARIFDPFFTTKTPGQGTGLGLASAYGIARQHGGRLELQPSERGALFRVLLPQAPVAAAVQMNLVPKPKGSLLLVDDESSLLDLLAPALGRQGYKVTIAGDGEAALAQWESQGGFDLLVTDLRMPGMDGKELARRLRSQKPALPVLFISGWSPETPDAGLETGTHLLAKPFRLAELYRALDQLQQS